MKRIYLDSFIIDEEEKGEEILRVLINLREMIVTSDGIATALLWEMPKSQ